MICKERSIGLPWFSTKLQIMTLFYLASRAARTQLMYSTELTTEHVFEYFGGELPGCSPPDWGISYKGLSASLKKKSCKRLGSRPKPSIKPCYMNRTIK